MKNSGDILKFLASLQLQEKFNSESVRNYFKILKEKKNTELLN